MVVNEETEWLLNWFSARRPGVSPLSTDLNNLNYFEAGLIDSMGIIELIGAIESHFGIRFNHGDYQQREFATIGGLVGIIIAKRAHL